MEGTWASILPVTPTIEILQTQTGSRGKKTMGVWGVEELWVSVARSPRQATPPRALAQLAGNVCCSLGIGVPGVDGGDNGLVLGTLGQVA